MPIAHALLKKLLHDAFPEAEITLTDLVGDEDHWAVSIISERFLGVSRVAQHKMVNTALHSVLGGTLHALSIQTSAPINTPLDS
jgi:stress-induced morphogen